MWRCFQKNPPGGIWSRFTSNKRKQWEAPPTGCWTCCLQSRRSWGWLKCIPHVAIKMNAMSMLVSTWPSFRHNGIMQFANGKLRHKNVSSTCWRQWGFAGNWLWRAEKLWRTCMSVTLESSVKICRRGTRVSQEIPFHRIVHPCELCHILLYQPKREIGVSAYHRTEQRWTSAVLSGFSLKQFFYFVSRW
jgi:hypothetical protein